MYIWPVLTENPDQIKSKAKYVGDKKTKRILPMQQILQNNLQYFEWKALMYIHLM